MNISPNETAKALIRKLEMDLHRFDYNLEILEEFYVVPGNIDALFKIGKFTFQRLLDALLESVIVNICRMFDPFEQGRFKNDSFYHLRELLPKINEKKEFEDKLNAMNGSKEIKDITELRNKIVAHSEASIVNSGTTMKVFKNVNHRLLVKIRSDIMELLCLAKKSLPGEYQRIGYAHVPNYFEGNPRAFVKWVKGKIDEKNEGSKK